MSNIFLGGAQQPTASSGYATVKSGTQSFPVEAPDTVANIRTKAGYVVTISADAEARRNNTVLGAGDTVNPGDTITFIRKVGEKG